ncbi:uncharacterized protein LOC135939749 isoform X1 [Cloeon dipterum]|uniref:uncharacterized protein LOC135939749 isoform X1 n=1 Tax=Cloeon dipterum TaxID=197152 RepID=UPI00321F7710
MHLILTILTIFLLASALSAELENKGAPTESNIGPRRAQRVVKGKRCRVPGRCRKPVKLRNPTSSSSYPYEGLPDEQSTPSLAESCSQQPFGKLSLCCQNHPKIFDFMETELRVCTNRTSNANDYTYYRTVLLEYVLHLSASPKNRIDLRRVPMAVKFMDCFFSERGWFDATKPELYTKTLVEEFIDNIETSWDDVMTDSIVNCSLVIRASNQPLTLMLPSQDDLNQKQSYLAFPFVFTQCVRKVLLMFCPTPNKPIISQACIDLRNKFKECDPLPKTSTVGSDYESNDYNTDYSYGEEPTTPDTYNNYNGYDGYDYAQGGPDQGQPSGGELTTANNNGIRRRPSGNPDRRVKNDYYNTGRLRAQKEVNDIRLIQRASQSGGLKKRKIVRKNNKARKFLKDAFNLFG